MVGETVSQTDIVTLSVVVHPFGSVTTNVYVPASLLVALPDTVVLAVVAVCPLLAVVVQE